MPEVATVLRNVYFDTAASPFLYNPQVYAAVSSLVGADKVLFGSDYALLRPHRLLAEIAASSLTPQEREAVQGGNAARVLGI
jgi:predicted TIM-barrel fold metal-dependent hydrolase